MKKDYKKYLEPEDVDSFSREEISSHSSLLTNRRLDIMFARLDEVRIEAWNNICVPNLKAYFSVLSGIYNNIFSVFDEEEIKSIKNYFDSYHQLFFFLFHKQKTYKCPSCGGSRFMSVSNQLNIKLRRLICLNCGSSFEAIRETRPNKYQICYQILLILDHVHMMITGFLQSRQFFFRLGKPQIKGIKQALKLYEKREKEVVEKYDKKLQRMVEEQHEPPT